MQCQSPPVWRETGGAFQNRGAVVLTIASQQGPPCDVCWICPCLRMVPVGTTSFLLLLPIVATYPFPGHLTSDHHKWHNYHGLKVMTRGPWRWIRFVFHLLVIFLSVVMTIWLFSGRTGKMLGRTLLTCLPCTQASVIPDCWLNGKKG